MFLHAKHVEKKSNVDAGSSIVQVQSCGDEVHMEAIVASELARAAHDEETEKHKVKVVISFLPI